jgi:hypothetical protein
VSGREDHSFFTVRFSMKQKPHDNLGGEWQAAFDRAPFSSSELACETAFFAPRASQLNCAEYRRSAAARGFRK